MESKMTFEDLWKELMEIRPIEKGQKVVLSKSQFKAMLKQSFEYGEANQKSSNSLFNGLFGLN